MHYNANRVGSPLDEPQRGKRRMSPMRMRPTGIDGRSARASMRWTGFLLLLPLALLAPAALLLAGCHSGARTLTPEAQATRLELGDFSILPPDGPGWLLASRQDDAVVFGRRDSLTHSEVALASGKESPRPITSQEDLLAYVREDWAASQWQKAARYQARQADLHADARLGPYCVWYRLQSEDHAAGNRGDAPFLLQRSMGLICFDPKQPRRLIHAGFTERGLPSEGSVTFDRQAERFLDGLQLASVAAAPPAAPPAPARTQPARLPAAN